MAEAARRPQQDLAAVEELLRYEAPNQYNVRRSMKEVTLHGVTIPAGNPFSLLGGSANRDPEAFTDADTFDIDRDRAEAQNLGFGYGVHRRPGRCAGPLESAVALERLLDFMPRYEVRGTSASGWRRRTSPAGQASACAPGANPVCRERALLLCQAATDVSRFWLGRLVLLSAGSVGRGAGEMAFEASQGLVSFGEAFAGSSPGLNYPRFCA